MKGIFLGLAIAAPVGVIGILCINRTLLQGYLASFLSGLGAATADSIYGFIGAFWIGFIANFCIEKPFFLKVMGGLFLIYLGLKTFLSLPNKQVLTVNRCNLISSYFSTFLLTLTNPMTIISFAASFAGLGLANGNLNYLAALMLVLGVFIGSSLWWLILSSLVSLWRSQVTYNTLKLINRISGIIMLIFAGLALGK